MWCSIAITLRDFVDLPIITNQSDICWVQSARRGLKLENCSLLLIRVTGGCKRQQLLGLDRKFNLDLSSHSHIWRKVVVSSDKNGHVYYCCGRNEEQSTQRGLEPRNWKQNLVARRQWWNALHHCTSCHLFNLDLWNLGFRSRWTWNTSCEWIHNHFQLRSDISLPRSFFREGWCQWIVKVKCLVKRFSPQNKLRECVSTKWGISVCLRYRTSGSKRRSGKITSPPWLFGFNVCKANETRDVWFALSPAKY